MTYWKEVSLIILALIGGVDHEENIPYDPLEVCYAKALQEVNPEVGKLKCEALLVKFQQRD
jgi:hypothetical protein